MRTATKALIAGSAIALYFVGVLATYGFDVNERYARCDTKYPAYYKQCRLTAEISGPVILIWPFYWSGKLAIILASPSHNGEGE